MARHRLNTKDWLLLGVTLLVVTAGIYIAWSANVVARVFLVNGLDVATQIAVDGATRGVPPGGRVEISLHRGLHQVKVTGVKGELLEEGPIDVPATSGAVAYNVLGAAPLYTETVIYGTGSGRSASPAVEFHGGKRLVVSPHADFVFTPAPKTISVDKSSTSSHTRLHFDLAAGGWETTTNWLHERGDAISALRVSLAVARAEPSAAAPVQYATRRLQELRGEQAALAYLRKILESRPDDLDLHRLHQHLMRRAGHFEEARAFYRSNRERHPTSALAAVLLARVEAPEPARALYQEALALEPQNLPARRGLAQLLFDRGFIPESVPLFEQVAENDPDYKYYVDDHVRALLRLGQAQKAVEVAVAAVKKAPGEWTLAVLYAELARTEGVPTTTLAQNFVDALAQKSRDPEYGVWMSSLAGMPVNAKALETMRRQGGPMAEAAALQIAAQKDPAEAWVLMKKAGPAVLDRLAAPVAVLLAAEFFRAGDTNAADQLFTSRDDLSLPTDALKAYVAAGTEHPELWRLPTDVRAVLDFVRARKLQGDRAPDLGLYAAATRREAFLGLAGRALKSWPPPEPARTQGVLVLHRRSSS